MCFILFLYRLHRQLETSQSCPSTYQLHRAPPWQRAVWSPLQVNWQPLQLVPITTIPHNKQWYQPAEGVECLHCHWVMSPILLPLLMIYCYQWLLMVTSIPLLVLPILVGVVAATVQQKTLLTWPMALYIALTSRQIFWCHQTVSPPYLLIWLATVVTTVTVAMTMVTLTTC